MCQLCTWSTIALFHGSLGGDQSETFSLWRSNELSSYVHRFVGGGQAAFGPFLNSGNENKKVFTWLWQESTLWCTSTTSVPRSARGCNLTSGGRNISPPCRSKPSWPGSMIILVTLQLVQFVMVFFHAMQPIFFQCDFPLAARCFFSQIKPDQLHFSLMFCGTGLQYFILFSAFYKKTYR